MKKIYALAFAFLCVMIVNAQWTKINVQTGYDLRRLQMITENIGYITGDSIIGLNQTGKIFRTFNAGNNWFEKTFYYQAYEHFHFINPDTGWIQMNDGQNSTIRRTYDGGNTWMNIAFQSPRGPMAFASATTGYITYNGAGVQGCNLYKSTDGGFTWNNTGVNIGVTGITDMLIKDSTTAHVGGLYGPKLGMLNLSLPAFTLYSDSFIVQDMVYNTPQTDIWFVAQDLTTFQTNIYKVSTMGGAITKVFDGSANNFFPNKIDCNSNTNFIACSDDGRVAYTYNAGNTWTIESTGMVGVVYDVAWRNNTVIAIGDSGQIYKRMLPASLAENSNTSAIVVFPNPANDVITISWDNTKANCTLFSVAGEKLKTMQLRNSTTVDINNLAAGIYFLKIESEKSVTIAKFIKN